MPEWLVVSLCVVFAIHLVAFARLAVVRKEGYYWLVTAVFIALTAAFGLRAWGPQITIGDLPLHRLFRYIAWGLAAITLPQLAYRLIKRFR